MLKIKDIRHYGNEHVVVFHTAIFANFFCFLVMLGGLALGFSILQMLSFDLSIIFIFVCRNLWRDERVDFWKNIIVNLSVAVIVSLIATLPSLLLLVIYQQSNFISLFLALFNSFLMVALLFVSGCGSVWIWLYWLFLSIILAINTVYTGLLTIFAGAFFVSLFVINVLIRHNLRCYAILAKEIKLKYWLVKKLALADLIFCFKKQKDTASDFVYCYFENSFQSYQDGYLGTNIFSEKKSVETVRETAFWWLISHFEDNLWYRKDFLFSAMLLYNRDFIQKWKDLALTHPLAKYKLDNFLANAHESFGNFIENPHYEITLILKDANLEEKFAQMVAEVSNEGENMQLAYNLLYISAGLAAQIEESQNYDTEEDGNDDEWEAWL